MTNQQDTAHAWSTLLLDDYGGARIGKTGLTCQQARMEIGAQSLVHPEYAHQIFALAPPDFAQRRIGGTYGLAYVSGGNAAIQVIGLTEAEAERGAKQAIDKYGPDSPREDWTAPDETGCRWKLVDLKPVVEAVYVVDMADVMEALGMPIPGCTA